MQSKRKSGGMQPKRKQRVSRRLAMRNRKPRQDYRAAPQASEQNQALFELLFKSTPDANLIINEQGQILAANHQAERRFGYRRAELIGQPVEMLIPNDLRQIHERHRQGFVERPRARAMGVGLELYGLRKNHTRFPADITLSPLRTEQGLLVLCVITDISLRRANQQALEEQTALVQLLQEIAASANEAASIHEAFQYAIDRLCAYLNWPIGHALIFNNASTLAPTRLWSATTPKGHRLETFRAVSEEIHWQRGNGIPGQVLTTGRPIWLTNPIDRPNFIRRDAAREAGLMTMLAFPVFVGREVVGVLEFFVDRLVEQEVELMEVLPHIGAQLGRVIERKRAEEALRKREAQLKTIVTNLPVILWAIDKYGDFLVFEGKGVRVLGMESGQMVGESIFERMKGYPELEEQIRLALSGQEMRFELPLPDGQTYEVYYTPYQGESGEVEGVVCLALDVTERKDIENELEEMKHRLMESVEVERLRLAQQLHDGPLQDLYGVFYQIQEVKNRLDDDTREMAENSLQTIQQVNSTLRFICGELRPTTLVHLGLQRAILSHIERVQERHAETQFYTRLMDDAQMLDPNNRLGLFRVYQNLINNVISHAEARHAWVRLSIDEDEILMEVQDNGKGFDVPSNWISLVRKGRFGLASAVERVEAMNGKIKINSQPGHGTLVQVTVPRSSA